MKTFLCAAILLCSCLSFAQTNNSGKKDTLVWTDGTKYVGTIIKTTINENNNSGEVQFMTEDGQMHNVPSSSIAQLKRATEPADNKLPPADKKASPVTPAQAAANDQTSVNWSDPAIPEKIVRKHRTGIGLTIVGSVLTVVGIGLIAGGAAANGETSSYVGNGTAQANVNIGVTGVVGVLMTIAGLPMMISGAVKLARSKKLARASRIYLR